MIFLTEILLILRDIGIALADLVTGLVTGRRRRLRYEHSIFVRAPRETAWRVVSSRDITYEGMVAMRIVGETVPGKPDFTRYRVSVGEQHLFMVLRTVEERPGIAIQHELIAEGSSPKVVMGQDDYLSLVLHDVPGGTQMFLTREVTPDSWFSRISIPLGARIGARRYKAKAEQMAAAPAGAFGAGDAGAPQSDADAPKAGPWGPHPAAPGTEAAEPKPAARSSLGNSSFGLTPNGIALSLLALASFSYLWGLQQALLVAAIIILHELGHAIAMLMVGIPVKGIYLVPFFGGAAIAATPYRSEGQIGFVALMGPGFSLVPTAIFALAANHTGSPVFDKAMELSAIINLLNLLPIVPLDGGIVWKAALVSINRTLAKIAGFAGAAAGLWLAWMVRDPILAVVVAIGVVVTLSLKNSTVQTPMRWPAALLLMVGFFVIAAAYVAILFLAKHPRLPV